MRDSAGFAPASLRPHRPGICARRGEDSRTAAYSDAVRRDAVLTIGNEVVSGDVANTNAAWLAQRLESLGVRVVLAAAVPDEIETDRRRSSTASAARVDHLIVTGGLGGTPGRPHARGDRRGVRGRAGRGARARRRAPRSASRSSPDYAARWAQLPAGSRPLRNPHGGAPGFVIENVWVLPGLPSEMEAMFDALRRASSRGDRPISSWRRVYPDARERHRPPARERDGRAGRTVSIGSYPRFLPDGPEVEIVLKSADAKALAEAVAWLEPELDDVASALALDALACRAGRPSARRRSRPTVQTAITTQPVARPAACRRARRGPPGRASTTAAPRRSFVITPPVIGNHVPPRSASERGRAAHDRADRVGREQVPEHDPERREREQPDQDQHGHPHPLVRRSG